VTTTPTTPHDPAAPRSRRALRPDDGRLVRGRKARSRIREAALALFRERGFDGATLRAIGARAGMGASSIYRHVESKEELLIDELAARQEEAWMRFRKGDDRRLPVRERLGRFLELEHALLAQDADFTTIALRASTQPEARVAKRVLALQDRTIGLVAEILQGGKLRGELARGLDLLAASRAIVHVLAGARIPWANGLVSAEGCRASIAAALDVLFSGLAAR
jgi:AcrR family transcriptional regulator